MGHTCAAFVIVPHEFKLQFAVGRSVQQEVEMDAVVVDVEVEAVVVEAEDVEVVVAVVLVVESHAKAFLQVPQVSRHSWHEYQIGKNLIQASRLNSLSCCSAACVD